MRSYITVHQQKNLVYILLMFAILLFPQSLLGQLSWFLDRNEKPSIENLKASIIVRPEGEIFPSFIIAHATTGATETGIVPDVGVASDSEIASGIHFMGDLAGMVGIKLTSPKEKSQVKFLLSSPELFPECSFDAVLPLAGREYAIFPKILWNFDFLRGIKQIKPVHISCELTINGEILPKFSTTIKLRTINDCLFYFEDVFGSHYPWWMYAAYINENHPEVDQILKDALDSKIVPQFDGYQSEDPADVYKQVFATWNVLHKRGIKYSSVENPASRTGGGQSQYVRFLDESLKLSQANCVDGCVLLASILRRVGIDAFLVMLPDHMFLGIYLDKEHMTKRFIETTELGSPSGEEPETDLELERLLGEKISRNPSWDSFVRAIRAGREKFGENRQNLETDVQDYFIIDIDRAREKGIIPISFQK